MPRVMKRPLTHFMGMVKAKKPAHGSSVTRAKGKGLAGGALFESASQRMWNPETWGWVPLARFFDNYQGIRQEECQKGKTKGPSRRAHLGT